MSVDIPQDLVPFVQAVISSGRCRSETEVVGEALRLFQNFEQRRKTLQADIHEGMNSGEPILGDEVFDRVETRADNGAQLPERTDIDALAAKHGVRPYDPAEQQPDFWPKNESVDKFLGFVRDIRKDNPTRSARS
jgi:putative addiction module CopG family antidote